MCALSQFYKLIDIIGKSDCLTVVALVYFKESTFNSVLCTSVFILEIYPRQTVYIVISPFSC